MDSYTFQTCFRLRIEYADLFRSLHLRSEKNGVWALRIRILDFYCLAMLLAAATGMLGYCNDSDTKTATYFPVL